MIIVDLFEYVGKNVRVYFEDGDIQEGKLEYVPTFSEVYGFRRPKHFYLPNPHEDICFRAYHVKKIEVISELKGE